MQIVTLTDETVQTFVFALNGDTEPTEHWYGERKFRPRHGLLVLVEGKPVKFKITGPIITAAGKEHASQTGEWHDGWGTSSVTRKDSWPAVARELWQYAINQGLI